MPFKLRLKKSRQYNVVSKSLFVCVVELLDGGSLECTLGSESTGRDCLDNVCQRLNLSQPEFFGLQYVPKNGGSIHSRWLEMDRPVKKQLDKYAMGSQLALRVMYYITSNVSKLLTDETSRYHYFLQLKMDVIDGKIEVSSQQAILLAGYSMQAEFGNYDPERHTPEYLKDSQLFPKHLIDNDPELTESAIIQHASLKGLPPSIAEEQYITACQQLDGYGLETFKARDQDQQDVYIGINLNGITVSYEINDSSKKIYLWKDIRNVINHKRYFTIECTIPSETVQFQFNDVQNAKQVWRMCVLQHTFHTKLNNNNNSEQENNSHQLNVTGGNSNTLPRVSGGNGVTIQLYDQRVPSAGNLTEIDGNFFQTPHFIGSGGILSNASSTNIVTGTTNSNIIASSSNQILYSTSSSSPIMRQRAQSTSCLDLTSSSSFSAYHPIHQNQTEVERLRALLPTYRLAPDYETAIQQKYHAARKNDVSNSTSDSNQQNSNANNQQKDVQNNNGISVTILQQHYPHLLYSSQPEIPSGGDPTYLHQYYQPDVTQHTPTQNLYRTAATTGIPLNTLYSNDKHFNYALGPQISTDGSTHVQLLHLYKPPPPYPSNRISSNSTPDLAIASSQANGILNGFTTSNIAGTNLNLLPMHTNFSGVNMGFVGSHSPHILTGSSPDLVSSRTNNVLNRAAVQYLKQYNYPLSVHHRQQLLQQHAAAVSTTSPSTTYALSKNSAYNNMPHSTYENLSTLTTLTPDVTGNQNFMLDENLNPNQSNNSVVNGVNASILDNIHKIYDDRGNILYCMPTVLENQTFLQQFSHSSDNHNINENLPSHSSSSNNINTTGNSTISKTEPIYQNFPLPWQQQQDLSTKLLISNDGNVTKIGGLAPSPAPRRESAPARTQMYENLKDVREAVQQAVENNAFNDNFISNVKVEPPSPNKEKIHENNTAIDHSSSNRPKINDTTKLLNYSKPSTSHMESYLSHEESNLSHTSSRRKELELNLSQGSHSSHKLLTESKQKLSETFTINETTSAITNLSLNSNNETFGNYSSTTTTSGISSTSSKDKKKKKWHLLGGGGSSSSGSKNQEKMKSATLGRSDKNKILNDDKSFADAKERHRWSTGLPRYQNQMPLILPTITKEMMCQLLEKKLLDSQLFFEFEKIPKKKPNADFTTALLPENTNRNRFKDVLPYEDNRVRLLPTKENKYGYINASHITATVGNKQRFYIAAQGPTKHTLEDFWHCVWQADVYLIVQLTDKDEDLSYVPTDQNRNITVGQFQILLEFSQTNGHSSTSKIQLCNTKSRNYRSIWHMIYGAWGDQGCPCPKISKKSSNGKSNYDPKATSAEGNFLEFLEELRSVRDHSVSQDVPPGHNNNPPTLVHCTAGVGRTGVTILCDLLLHILDHNQDLDIIRTITLLRHQRAHMVQTVAQYKFVYSLLIYYLKQTRLI